jgi:hypothetical protein
MVIADNLLMLGAKARERFERRLYRRNRILGVVSRFDPGPRG